MRKTIFCGVGLLFAQLLTTDAFASGTLFRAYLSVDGNDSNPCTVTAPCRLLPAALGAVAANGEIWILDSANFNTSTVTISQNVTILAIPGAVGSLVANNGNALVIGGNQDANATLVVTLRNLVIRNYLGSSNMGVSLATDGGYLIVDRCAFSGALTVDISTHLYTNQSDIQYFNATILDSTFQDYTTGAISVIGNSNALATAFIDNNTFIDTAGSSNGAIYSESAELGITHNHIQSGKFAVTSDSNSIVSIGANEMLNLSGDPVQLANNANLGVGQITSVGTNNMIYGGTCAVNNQTTTSSSCPTMGSDPIQ